MKNLFSFFSRNELLKSLSIKQSKGKDPLLLTPGPVLLSSPVKKALSQAMWHHRSLEFKQTLKQVSSDLQEIFQTKQPVLILNSTGTGAMEAALSNTLSSGDEVLCVCAGKFGERWKDIAQAFGVKAHSLDVPMGESVSASALKKELERNKQIRALLVSACETSTGTEQPIKELSQILRNYPQVLFMVDGMTGVGAMELSMDEWGIDVLVAGSQKSFMLPTGLAFIALSKKAWTAGETSSCPSYYFDLKKEKQAQIQGQTAFSSSVTLIRALKESLSFIKKQGLKSCILKCQDLKKSTHAFCESLGLSLYSSRPANSVTAIQIPENLSADSIKKNLQDHQGIVFAGGQGVLKGKILRMGHLGPISPADHFRALRALALELKKKDPLAFNDKKVKEALKRAKRALHRLKNR